MKPTCFTVSERGAADALRIARRAWVVHLSGVMRRQTATTAKPLPLSERKAALAQLVKEGKVSAAGAKLIDFRELTDRERAHAETLVPKARRALARSGKQAA